MPVTTVPTRQPHERHMVNVSAAGSSSGGNAGEAGSGDGVIKGIKDIGGGARGQGAEEVAKARPDAEANERVTLVRSEPPGGGGKEEAVKDGKEAPSTCGRGRDSRVDEGSGAHWRPQHWMARGHS